MSLTINTNIAALHIARRLSASQDTVGTSMQRLSSGIRINSAADDPAGLAIIDGMTSIIRGQSVAMRNANDAVSFSQIALGALSSVTHLFQRMRDLAVESANDTNTADNRAALHTEFSQLQAEIKRIISNTQFNGLPVFDGAEKTFQIGSGTSAYDHITTQGIDLTSDTSKTGVARLINNGISLATVNVAKNAFIASGGTFSSSDGNPAAGNELDAMNNTLGEFTQNIPASAQQTYDEALGVFNGAGGTFSTANGNPLMPKNGTQTITVSAGPPPITQSVAIATPADISAYNTFITAQAAYFASVGIEILDQPSSLTAITTIDSALSEIETEASRHGALQNRMTTVISNLQASIENQSAARSRIMDTDFAHETAALARNQILQKTATALLTQANQSSNTILALLQI